MAGQYVYYKKDGAIFRKPASSKLPAVDEVKHGDRWVPYEGDRLAPVYFGDQISAAEACDPAVQRTHQAIHQAGLLAGPDFRRAMRFVAAKYKSELRCDHKTPHSAQIGAEGY